MDVIIDESYSFATGCFVRLDDFVSAHSLSSYTRTIPAIANKNVYTIAGTASQTIQEGDYTGSVGLDWYERGTARADEVRRISPGWRSWVAESALQEPRPDVVCWDAWAALVQAWYQHKNRMA